VFHSIALIPPSLLRSLRGGSDPTCVAAALAQRCWVCGIKDATGGAVKRCRVKPKPIMRSYDGGVGGPPASLVKPPQPPLLRFTAEGLLR
jgi:hypothetical protein